MYLFDAKPGPIGPTPFLHMRRIKWHDAAHQLTSDFWDFCSGLLECIGETTQCQTEESSVFFMEERLFLPNAQHTNINRLCLISQILRRFASCFVPYYAFVTSLSLFSLVSRSPCFLSIFSLIPCFLCNLSSLCLLSVFSIFSALYYLSLFSLYPCYPCFSLYFLSIFSLLCLFCLSSISLFSPFSILLYLCFVSFSLSVSL